MRSAGKPADSYKVNDQIPADVRVVIVDDHPMARDWTRASIEESEGLTVTGVGAAAERPEKRDPLRPSLSHI
jgi:hypothetical protein